MMIVGSNTMELRDSIDFQFLMTALRYVLID